MNITFDRAYLEHYTGVTFQDITNAMLDCDIDLEDQVMCNAIMKRVVQATREAGKNALIAWLKEQELSDK